MSEIDVANCIYYQECIQFEDGEEIYHICNDDKNTTTYCQDSYNCYYKQLQQLKQENDELKKSIKILKDTIKIQARTIDKTQSDWFNNFSEMKNKYEQCLDEIEEICNKTPILNRPVGNLVFSILDVIKQAKEGGE